MKQKVQQLTKDRLNRFLTDQNAKLGVGLLYKLILIQRYFPIIGFRYLNHIFPFINLSEQNDL